MGCESTILLNGGFEAWTDGVADNWEGGTQESVIVHGGDSSCSLNDYTVYQSLTPQVGEYTLDFWYNHQLQGDCFYLEISKSVNGEFFPTPFGDQEYLQSDLITWSINEYLFLLPPTDGWENYTITFQVTSSIPHRIRFLELECGNAYLDDVCLYPVDSPPGDDALSATCGESLFKLDILRQRIRTDGTNYYLVVG